MPRPLHFLPVILPFLSVILADSKTDAARLGAESTSIPLWRSGSGTNIVTAGIGSPPQDVNLTLTTNVEFIAVATDPCVRCTQNAAEYFSEDSSSFDLSQEAISYSAIYPVGSLDTLLLTGMFAQDTITDAREDGSIPRPIALVSTVRRDAATAAGGTEQQLSDASSGFWGLGVFQPEKSRSIIPDMLTVTTQGQPSGATSWTIGFDIATYSTAANAQAGTVVWGGVPSDAYQGNFNWINANTSVAGGWGVTVDRIRAGSTVIDTSANYGSLDPGFDGIYVATRVAEEFFDAIPEASRDPRDATRWNLPCDTNISMTVTVAGYEYKIASSELVQSRDRAGRTCWSSVIAWSNGSLPEQLGEIRLGTPFMSGIYAALYYSENEQFVGIAGKPGSVNALNVGSDPGKPNMKLAGILIGTLLGVFILLFILCYSRNRNSAQSIWYRAIRRQHRFQTNAMVRAATLPPPMMIAPTAPLMGVRPPMNPYTRPMMGMPPISNMMFGPPPYQTPMLPPQQPPYPQAPQQIQQMPAAIEPQQRGIYSPRQQMAQMQNMQTAQAAPPTTLPAGIPHPRDQGYAPLPEPPKQHQPTPSKSIRWGPVASGQQPTAASSASERHPQAGQQGWQDQGRRYDQWLREHSGVGQDQERYPDHQPTRTQTHFSTSAPAALPMYQEDKKRRWNWSKKSRSNYSPVQQPETYGAMLQSQVEKGEKRRSWFNGRRMGESEAGR